MNPGASDDVAKPAALLDVNVIIALLDPSHVHHERAHEWFGAYRESKAGGWATCPIVETGVVRVVSLVDGRLLAGPLEFSGPVWCVAASPDGERLAIACEEGDPSRAWLWRPWEDELVPLPGHDQARVVHAAYSPSHALLGRTI